MLVGLVGITKCACLTNGKACDRTRCLAALSKGASSGGNKITRLCDSLPHRTSIYRAKCAPPKEDYAIHNLRLIGPMIDFGNGSRGRESLVPLPSSERLFNLFGVLVGSGKESSE
jgi:hypothetical protein